MTGKERELFTQALKLITELDKEGLVLEMGLILEMREALAQPEQADKQELAVQHLWECVGRWSSYLAVNGTQANMAPPNWLLDAVKAATSQSRKEWVGLTINEVWDVYEEGNYDAVQFARAVESRLKELNT